MTDIKNNVYESSTHKGNSLFCLFNLPAGSRVLIVGESLAEWKQYFRSVCCCTPTVKIGSGWNNFHIILFHPCRYSSKQLISQDISKLKALLAPNGYLFCLVKNFYSLATLKDLKRGLGRQVLSATKCGYSGYKNILISQNFGHVGGYLPLPDRKMPEEIVDIGSKLLDVPYSPHWLIRFFNSMGLYRYVYDGYLFICGKQKVGVNPFFDFLAQKIRGYLKSENAKVSLERFDMRSRGAVVLYLLEVISGEMFIARIVSDSRTDTIVKKNRQFLEWLHQKSELAHIKNLVPFPVEKGSYQGVSIHIETMVPGKLAWKAIRRKVRDTIYKEAVNFIFQLNKHTKENTLLDKDKLESLFERDLQRFNKITCINNELKNNILKMISIIKDKLLGRKIWLVASHGDYGYGNILIDPDTGRLQGVIDWDTGRKEEFPWIDMLNMAIQNEKSNNSNRLSGAVRAIASRTPFAGLINNCSVYEREFKVGNGVLKILFYIALIRYMGRAAQYESIFNAEQNEYLESFNYLNNVLPL
jgi:hypothetical protein